MATSKQRVIRISLSILLAGIFLMSMIASASAAPTMHVHAGESIQAAIDAAVPGTAIMVGPGTYYENLEITKDGIRLKGAGPNKTFLMPPDSGQDTLCSDAIAGLGEPGVFSGICISGDLNVAIYGTEVNQWVSDVRVSGFNINGFTGPGIMMLGARNTFIRHNVAWGNEDYGIAAFVSTGDHFVANTTYENGEAGLYIGDSSDANAKVVGNESYDNFGFGIFLRNAANGMVAANTLYDNCIGLFVLNEGIFVSVADAGASNWTVRGNQMNHNNKACPASEEGPPISGIGAAIIGGHDVSLKGNTILDNQPGGETVLSGGVVVVSAAEIVGTTDSTDITVMGNRVLGNSLDLFWDETGSGNVFKANNCETSMPDGLCH